MGSTDRDMRGSCSYSPTPLSSNSEQELHLASGESIGGGKKKIPFKEAFHECQVVHAHSIPLDKGKHKLHTWFFSFLCSELLHQLLAKNKPHSTTIYVQQPPSECKPPPALLLLHEAKRLCHCCGAMHITQLNRECLLHLFSFLDKNSRKNLAETCHKLLEVFQDPLLWSLLHFHSPVELKKDNFFLGPALKYLSICWYSERVKVCNIEDWMKKSFQKDFCNRHENTVSDFLLDVCNRCPNLLSLTLSGCGHVTDDCILQVLKNCPNLKSLKLENCVRITDHTLEAVTLHGASLRTLHVDFCRNITQAGLERVRQKCPSVMLRAERSANMIPDSKPEKKLEKASRKLVQL